MTSMKYPNSFNIIPVQNKVPQVAWKEFTERQQTLEEKENLLRGSNEIGIVTGSVSRIIVLDDDGGLVPSGYKVPKTWTVKTPRGGTHHYFKWTPELDKKITTKVGVLPKVDTRGDGGYVVFYGFCSPYFTTPLALPPQWLIDLLPNKDQQITTKTVLDNLEGIKEGNRNDSFTRIAGSLRARGYSAEEMFELLQSKAREVSFPDNELMTICESVGRYTPRIEVSENASSVDEFLKDIETVDWMVPGLIADQSICFLAGLEETSKTWMCMDLAISLASETNWLNRFSPTKAFKVLYIDQEQFKGETQRRFKALLSQKKADCGSNLLIKANSTIRLDLQNSYDAFDKMLGETKPNIVIIDSFKTFHTKDINSNVDMQMVLERVKELRTKYKCSFVFIYHENKGAYSRKEEGKEVTSQFMAGAKVLSEVPELIYIVDKHDSESSMVYHVKNRLGNKTSPFLVKVIDMNEARTKINVEAY